MAASRPSREDLLEAMESFDKERDTDAWREWESRGQHRYAIWHESQPYPTKRIISLGTGTPVGDFSGGDEANGIARSLGLMIVLLPGRPPRSDASTYLLTYNPTSWQWPELPDRAKQTASGECSLGRWDTGNTRKVRAGDRFFLLRQEAEPRGIFGSGIVISDTFEDSHWDDDRADSKAWYVAIEFETLLDPGREAILTKDSIIAARALTKAQIEPRRGGTRVPDDSVPKLERLWSAHLREVRGTPPSQTRRATCAEWREWLAQEIPGAAAPSDDLQGIQAFVAQTRYAFSPALVAQLHAALHALPHKRFVLLTGLSGTGKTLLTRVYAHAYHGIPLDEENPLYRIIPVRPNWNSPRDLLGYWNPIESCYEKTPFLEFLLAARSDPDNRYFVVLDEMNLAPVEHYFADVLSAMESNQAMPLMTEEQAVQADPYPYADWKADDNGPQPEEVREKLILWYLGAPGGEATEEGLLKFISGHPVAVGGQLNEALVLSDLERLREAGRVERDDESAMWRLSDTEPEVLPASLPLPENLCILGTVNVDETTHTFSDKVLDRALTIELWDVDWQAFKSKLDEDIKEAAAWVMPKLESLHAILGVRGWSSGIARRRRSCATWQAQAPRANRWRLSTLPRR